MPNPTRKHTRSRRDKRRANWRLTLPTLTRCPQCARFVRAHHACLSCGYYRGRKVIVVGQKESKD